MAYALKQSAAWTRLWPSVLGIAAALGSIYLLTLALKRIPMTVAYVVWTGIGAVGVVVVGALLFNESLSLLRLACIVLVVAGTIGLRTLEG